MAYNINTFLIDLDGVLVTPKLTRSIPNRVAQYAVRYLGYDVGSASHRCREAYRRNGTNLEGFLQEGHAIDHDHYHSFIHGQLQYKAHLEKAPALKNVLNTIPVKKYVFTNANLAHAETCLAYMGIDSCFDGIIGHETLQAMYTGQYTACKPKHVSMDLALSYAKADPLTTLFFDDQPRNIHMGMDCGVRSVLVGESNILGCEYFAHLPTLLELQRSLFSSYFV